MGIWGYGRSAFGAGAVIAMAAGCAGAGSPPQLRASSDDWLASQTCKSDHGVSVKPCTVDLTFANPKADVTTIGPEGGTFTSSDTKCVSDGIAEVTRKSDNHYVVIAGNTQGKCTARFTDKAHSGKTIGTAALSIAFFKRDHCPPTCLTFATVAQ